MLFWLPLVVALPLRTEFSLDLLPFYYPSSSGLVSTNFIGTGTNPTTETERQALGFTFLYDLLNLTQGSLQVSSAHTDENDFYHMWVNRVVQGIPVDNQDCAVHIRDGAVGLWSCSFDASESLKVVPPPNIIVSMEDAIKNAEIATGLIKYDQVETSTSWIMSETGKLVHTIVFELRLPDMTAWIKVYVDSEHGQIVHSINYGSDATYQVIQRPGVNPDDGFSLLIGQDCTLGTPMGWTSSISGTADVEGNNVVVLLPGDEVEASTPGLTDPEFLTAFDPLQEPSTAANKRASAVNLFYVNNIMHDISSVFGFNESQGNFQADNFQNEGGLPNDAVTVLAQSNIAKNNANFFTPPDGHPPKMNMFLWNYTTPMRDSGLENDIIMHEYTHGISNRMIGGRMNVNCLQSKESKALGEGWSDAVANILLRTAADTRFTEIRLAKWVTNSLTGLRDFPYTTDMVVNPLLYSDFKTRLDEKNPHASGVVWATMLNEMYWDFVGEYGFVDDWTNQKAGKGNTIALQLIIRGNPGPLEARDGIVATSEWLYGPLHTCLIFEAFARRGLGFHAADDGNYVNNYDMPPKCR